MDNLDAIFVMDTPENPDGVHNSQDIFGVC